MASGDGRYEPLGAPVYWIKGNNENFDRIAAGDLPWGLHFIPNGTAVDVGWAGAGCEDPEGGSEAPPYTRVAALGGTLAPTMYDVAPGDLPHPKKSSARATEVADRRRHFVRAEVAACAALREVDVLLTHEAARPFRPFEGGRGPDAGKTPVNEVLAAVRPRLHLFGHHHRFTEQTREGVRSVGLDLVTRSYLLIDRRTFDYELRSTE